MPTEYFIKRGDSKFGPLSPEQLRLGIEKKTIKGSDQISAAKDSGYVDLREVYKQAIKGEWAGAEHNDSSMTFFDGTTSSNHSSERMPSTTQTVVGPSNRTLVLCDDCGSEISRKAEVCPQCGAPNERVSHTRERTRTGDSPNRTVAIILALFLGVLGIHLFYVGRNTEGLVYLLLGVLLSWTIVVPLILGIFAIVHVIQFATMSESDWNKKYGK